MPATQLIKLKKDHGAHKSGAQVYATKEEIKAAKLKAGDDYEPLGTCPSPRKSTLNEKPEKSEGAKP